MTMFVGGMVTIPSHGGVFSIVFPTGNSQFIKVSSSQVHHGHRAVRSNSSLRHWKMAHSSHRTTELTMKTTGGCKARLRNRTPVVSVARNSKHLVVMLETFNSPKGKPYRW